MSLLTHDNHLLQKNVLIIPQQRACVKVALEKNERRAVIVPPLPSVLSTKFQTSMTPSYATTVPECIQREKG